MRPQKTRVHKTPHTFFLLSAFAALILSAGCLTGRTQLDGVHPLAIHQKRVQRFDPYPDPNIGPSVQGLRPRGFLKQVSEPARSRQRQPSAPSSDKPALTLPAT